MAINYHKQMLCCIEENKIKKELPKLLLHACCAPCSSHSINVLREGFDITIFYFNPNVDDFAEYQLRKTEQQKFCEKMGVKFIEGEYCPQNFYNAVCGLESEEEGGARCFKCYELRLEETAKMAKQLGFMYFATTLTISPLKNATVLNEKGFRAQEKYGVKYLATDLKKGGGYLESIRLSKEHGLYRQNYCGCSFSKTK